MPYDNTGTFTIINSCEQDRINGVSIDSAHMDANLNDIAGGLSNVMLRSGAVPMEGDLNVNNYKVQNVADGTTSTDAVNKGQLDSVNNAAVKLTGNQTIAGTKTFSTTPIVGTKANSDNSTAAASTAFVKNQGYASDNAVVKLTGNQSIAGAKTFSNACYGTASDAANSLLTTVASLFETSGTNKRYLKLGNGWIVQVGEFTYDSGNDEVEVTLPYTMSSTKYYVGVTFLTTARNSPGCITGRFTNKFKYKSSSFQSSGTALYIVVGK